MTSTLRLASSTLLVVFLAVPVSAQEPWFTEIPNQKIQRGGRRLPFRTQSLQGTTASLIAQRVERLPTTYVQLERTSPFDALLKRNDLRADSLLDLTVKELVDFPVSL